MEISGKIRCMALAGLIGGGLPHAALPTAMKFPYKYRRYTWHSYTSPTEPEAVDPTVTGVLTSSQAGQIYGGYSHQLKQLCNPQDQRGAGGVADGS